MDRARGWIVVAGAVVLAAVALAVREPVATAHRMHALARAAPGLDPELARHVVADSDEAWLSYCRDAGTATLADAFQTIRHAQRSSSYSEFLRHRETRARAHARIGRGFRRVFGFVEPERVTAGERARSAEQEYRLHQADAAYIAVVSNIRRAPEDRLRELDALARDFRARAEFDRAILVDLAAIPIELEARRPDRHRARLESVLREARRLEQVLVQCQVLGHLGVVHWSAGHEDSMRARFDEGIAIARRHGFLDHAVRLLRFYAVFHVEQGRLALAFERLAEAQRLCEQPGGQGAPRIRMQIEHAKLVARLGCWDLLDRSLRRLPPLLRGFPRDPGRKDELAKLEFDADRLGARLAFATGHVDRGIALMRRWDGALPGVHHRVGHAELFDEWSEGLEGAGRLSEALAICERGLVHCDTAFVPDRRLALLLRRPRLLTRLHRLEEAAAALDTASAELARAPHVDARHRIHHGVARADLLHRAGRVAAARRLVRAVFAEFRSHLRRADAGALGHLELEESGALRDAMHRIAGFTPAAGYRFELEWRALTREVGAARRPGRGGHAASAGGPTRQSLDGEHLVFHFMDDVLLRWTAGAQGVSLDTLPLTARESLERVRDALGLLQSELPARGRYLGPRARAVLRPLGRTLLAGLDLDASRPRALDLSPDGPLLALPFEALPVETASGEAPLALAADVAYVTGLEGERRRPDGRTVVVAHPTLAPELRRRHGWARELPPSAGDASAARVRWPRAEVLEGERATKAAVLERWPGASVLYLASHHVRDLDAPFLGFVPLATPPDAPPDAGILESADIHELDLSACRLAVLASCASGAPYRDAVRPGASLGDAFLDAGAGAVVQSFWDVGDAETRAFMSAFLAALHDDTAPIPALAAARRRMMRSADRAPPRFWAAWSIKVAGPRVGAPGATAFSAR